jgi:aryl-alcohol dehydrogenase-like predicted oxidoreductase
MRALADLVQSGKVRYIGHSNFSGWQTAECYYIAKAEHLTPFISAQNQYSLLDRGVEKELAPACQKFGLGILPYFPLASGFLTGKYRRGETPPEGARLSNPAMQGMAGRIMNDRNWDMLEKLEGFAQQHGKTMVDLAVAWLASKPFVGSVIAGATKPEQVDANVRAGDWKLTPKRWPPSTPSPASSFRAATARERCARPPSTDPRLPTSVGRGVAAPTLAAVGQRALLGALGGV